MKYHERPIISCVPHLHLKKRRNYRYCTGESIVSPDKLKAVLNQSTENGRWIPFITYDEWDIGKIQYVRPWPTQPNVSSQYFYVIGIRQMFIDLANVKTEASIYKWHEKYKNKQFIMTVPIFADTQFPNEPWYVSNEPSLNTFNVLTYPDEVDNVEPTISMCVEMLHNRCYTVGSSWLLLFALCSLNEISHKVLCSLLNKFNGNYLVSLEEPIPEFYYGLAHPMICDIIGNICSSWFSPTVYNEINGCIDHYIKEIVVRPYYSSFVWFYRDNDCYHFFYSTLKSMDGASFYDIIDTILSTKIDHFSHDDSSVPWVFPFFTRVALCSKKEWRYWNQHSNEIYKKLHKVYFQKRGSICHFFYTITVCLSYLFKDLRKKHRIVVLWNQLLSYIRELPVSLPESFYKVVLYFYKRKLKYPIEISIPFYFLKSIPMPKELFMEFPSSIPFKNLYKLIQHSSIEDPHSKYYIRYLDKRALTKLYCCSQMDSYLVGFLLQNHFKEHLAELFS